MENDEINVIIISGLAGSGKGVLTRMLAKKLNWGYLSIGDLWREQHAEFIKKTGKKISFHEYWVGIGVDEQIAMDEKVRERIKKGKVVCDFRYTKLAQGLRAFRAFVTAPILIRVQRAMKTGRYPGKSAEQVKEILEIREDDELSTGKLIYGNDYDFRAPEQYDLVIDSGETTVEEEAEIILNSIEKVKKTQQNV